ncbi:hypothetical protein GCM10023238_33040 [Streptomyces heliomycini]
MAEGYSYDITDEAQATEMMRYRDRVMAENTAWWHRHTGDRILLSAHNTHVSYDAFDPRYPKTQGAFLRDTLGGDYVSIGFTFHSGAFKAFGTEDNVIRTYRVDAARPGSNEYTLDRARQRDYVLDLRTVPPLPAHLAVRTAPHPEHRRRLARPHGVPDRPRQGPRHPHPSERGRGDHVPGELLTPDRTRCKNNRSCPYMIE